MCKVNAPHVNGGWGVWHGGRPSPRASPLAPQKGSSREGGFLPSCARLIRDHYHPPCPLRPPPTPNTLTRFWQSGQPHPPGSTGCAKAAGSARSHCKTGSVLEGGEITVHRAAPSDNLILGRAGVRQPRTSRGGRRLKTIEFLRLYINVLCPR